MLSHSSKFVNQYKPMCQGRRGRSGKSGERRTTFWPSMLSAMSLFSRFGSFYILPLILFDLPQFIDAIINNARRMCPSQGVNTLKKYNDTCVIILMYRVERKPDVAACEHQRCRSAYTSVQSDQRLSCSLPGKYN